MGIVLVPSQGLGIQGLKLTGVTSDCLLLLCVQVANVPLQRAHVQVELTAHLTWIFKIQMYTLFVASQTAFVRCSIVTLIARIFHSQVDSVLMPFHGTAAKEAGPAEVAHFPTVRVEAGLMFQQLFLAGSTEVTEVT